MILDFLHANPGALFAHIIRAVAAAGEETKVENDISTMLRRGELTRAETSARGKTQYLPAVRETMSADAIRDSVLRAQSRKNEKRDPDGVASGSCSQSRGLTAEKRYIHRCGNLPPIQNQRGQGAVRRPANERPNGA